MLELVTIKIILTLQINFKDTFFLEIGKKLLGHNADSNSKRCQLGILKYKNGSECSGLDGM